jgi:hypothetical protein
MGLIRKSLFVVTAGVVAPWSKKQKVAAQTLAAIRGASAERVERTGTRRAALGPEPVTRTRRSRSPVPKSETAEYRAEHVPGSREYRERHPDEATS